MGRVRVSNVILGSLVQIQLRAAQLKFWFEIIADYLRAVQLYCTALRIPTCDSHVLALNAPYVLAHPLTLKVCVLLPCSFQ